MLDKSIQDVSQATGRPANHPAVLSGRIGVLLVNLGTPEATDYWSVRRYLKEFLSDRRVIETPKLIWWFILNGIILTFRPGKAGKNYKKIWNNEQNEGPLKTFTRAQSEKLNKWLEDQNAEQPGAPDHHPTVICDWAMRYGKPAIASGLSRLQQEGCDRILLVPLYPQYAAATTASVCDKAFDALRQMRWQPTLRVAHPWYDDPAYINALAASLKNTLEKSDKKPEVIVASFHGIPQSYFDKGDPYYCHCAKTTRLLREKMGLNQEQLVMTFQSRFGPTEYIKPYTDETLKSLAQKGIKNVAVITPGFTADCLETIDEIGEENRDYFLEAGGEVFTFVPCLNDSDAGMAVLRSVIQRELAGWRNFSQGSQS